METSLPDERKQDDDLEECMLRAFFESSPSMLLAGGTVEHPLSVTEISYPECGAPRSSYDRLRDGLVGSAAKETIIFHGTPPSNIRSIFANGFDVTLLGSHCGNRGLIGAGISVTTSARDAVYYCYELGKGGYVERTHFQLVVCKALLGNIADIGEGSFTGIACLPGYDSHRKGEEYAIFDPDRLLPLAVLHLDATAHHRPD